MSIIHTSSDELFLDIVVCGCSSREGLNRCPRGLGIVVVERESKYFESCGLDQYGKDAASRCCISRILTATSPGQQPMFLNDSVELKNVEVCCLGTSACFATKTSLRPISIQRRQSVPNKSIKGQRNMTLRRTRVARRSHHYLGVAL